MVAILEGNRILHVKEFSVLKALHTLKKTATGPDFLPHWFWSDYATEMTPVIIHTFDLSLREQAVPGIWKIPNVRPIPKKSLVNSVDLLRPISVTAIIMHLFERFVFANELKFIMQDQFAYRQGCSSRVVLLYNQHFWIECLDEQSDFVRIMSFDFSKAFDMVSHRGRSH